ncbi:MAG TPA: TlpA family protein disulfide reductase, partial [Anaerolineae bacterium]|nr:TlpA family protein disulfide reductase [Anaerolineae bacterium]
PTVSAFVKEIGLTYPILLDMGLASNDYLVRLLPTTFFVDRQGIIRAVYSGPMNAAILEERLRSIYP